MYLLEIRHPLVHHCHMLSCIYTDRKADIAVTLRGSDSEVYRPPGRSP